MSRRVSRRNAVAMRRILLAGVAVLSLSAVPVAAAEAGGVVWGACPGAPVVDPRQECATVRVPMDYRAPGGDRIELAVSRIRTAKAGLRRGVLLLIPGGPGSSGINRPSSYVSRLPVEVLDRYDLVGFDPRGVGRSTPVSCRLATDDIAPAHLYPWPAPDGNIAGNVERARRIAETCGRDGGELLRHISTRNEARDIDRIRRALGEERISYWGVSYGTYAGAVYATMFPERTDRVVLDSSGDPNPRRVARGWAANYGVGVEDRFPDFAAWVAARHTEYGLGADATAVRETFLRLAAGLDRQPLPWPGANPPQLTGNVLRSTMLSALYSDADFPRLAGLMRAAMASGPLPSLPAPPESVQQNTTAAAIGTLCNDVGWPDSVRAHQRDVDRDRLAHPLTAGMPVNIFPCAFWPHPLAERTTRITPHGPSNVLLVNNLRDPSTPHSGALRMRRAFGDRARMVSVDSGGHGAYLANGNACGDRTVTAFLVDGTRPAHDILCGT